MVKPSVLVTRRWPASVEAQLQNRFDVVLNKGDRPLTQSDLKEAVKLMTRSFQRSLIV